MFPLPESSRARFSRTLAPAGGALLCLLFFVLPGRALPAGGRPNLLLVTIDTLRADHLGCYGYAPARTPVLDRLASEGIRFERAFSAVPLTLPSHATILTGTYPPYHGVRDNSGFVLSAKQTTLAEVLRQAGYQTAAFVGAFVLDSKFGLDQGFGTYGDDFDLSRYQNVSPGYIQHPGGEVVSRALGWLAGHYQHPFFLWVHLYDPHDPYTPPEPYASHHPGRPYDGEIEYTDSNVGRLLEWLRRQGLYERTLILVVGDHGESLGEHGEQKHGLFLYNATLHVPFLMRLPGGVPAGRTISRNVGTVDVVPTVLQALGVERSLVPPNLQGRGLLSLVLGKAERSQRELYAESYYGYYQFEWSPLRALIRGNRKLILAPRVELYNLAEDFRERRDLAGRRQSVVQGLRSDLEETIRRLEGARPAQAARRQPDARTLEKLRSLGYLALSAPRATLKDYSSLPDPKGRIALYNRVLDLFEHQAEGRYSGLTGAYQAILKENPRLKIVRYKLGQALFHEKRYRAAAEQFREVIRQVGGPSLATFDLAQTYMRMGRTEDAIEGFLETLRVDPDHYRARTNLGVLYKKQGRYTEAIQQLEKALELAPRSVLALNNLGVAYSLSGEQPKAEETLVKALALAPKNAILHANLSLVYRRMGRARQAREELETARRLNPALFRRRNP